MDRIFERYRALPASPERDLKTFRLQIKAEIAARLPVCHLQCRVVRYTDSYGASTLTLSKFG